MAYQWNVGDKAVRVEHGPNPEKLVLPEIGKIYTVAGMKVAKFCSGIGESKEYLGLILPDAPPNKRGDHCWVPILSAPLSTTSRRSVTKNF